jgi:transcriptional antiterminator NusG
VHRQAPQFDEGDWVRILGGPFSNFNGVVGKVDPVLRKATVSVQIFGRETPVEVDLEDLGKGVVGS